MTTKPIISSSSLLVVMWSYMEINSFGLFTRDFCVVGRDVKWTDTQVPAQCQNPESIPFSKEEPKVQDLFGQQNKTVFQSYVKLKEKKKKKAGTVNTNNNMLNVDAKCGWSNRSTEICWDTRETGSDWHMEIFRILYLMQIIRHHW